ncbi:terminase small subunit [Bradyrhizobium zhanjiangense]|uniref:Terminase small subunit n=1 Tax=Bradyrhizobium zhanjiangense TaxID=1325107 RepID=A0A4Q0S757_9BRAD|nr:terminase small subunit [Bradyrhizobium zhanjiangense]RXH31998.1 hypothetical protein XH94_32555 [Bradyrhizobium zhanjiangense]
MGKLRNPKREMFAVEVAAMTPVDRAYLAAGYRSKPKWARPNGSKLAAVPEVAARISELRREFTASCALSVEYLQRQLLPAAEANVADFLSDDGKVKALSALPREQTAAIAAVKFHENGAISELKLIPKEAAVNTLLRSVGAIVEQHAHAHAHGFVGPEGLADRLNAARERMALGLATLSHEDQVVLANTLEAITDETTDAPPSDAK